MKTNLTTILGATVMSAMASMAALFPAAAYAGNKDWPTYNRTLTSDRYVTLSDIDTKNAANLKILCSFDIGEQTSFQSGLLQVDGALYATTEHDIFSIDPNTCKLNWRTHEDFESNFLKVNRGAAWLDKRLFRGTSDGHVLAYDGRTGKKLWSTAIADPAKGESVPAAPIAWEGLVFIGNAGGDNKGVRGRMYALDAKDGHIMWQFDMVPKTNDATWKNGKDIPITGGATWTSYSLDPVTGMLYVPAGNPAPDFMKAERPGENNYASSVVVLEAKTGAYQKHFQLVKGDFHDWDISSAPALFLGKTGQRMLAEAPKDGHLYLIDLTTGKLKFRKPATTIENAAAPLTPQAVRFCPGTQGGAEWNGPAFDPAENMIFTGEVDWCTTVRTMTPQALKSIPAGKEWSGATEGFGTQDDPKKWSGWLTAFDADSGEKRWQFHAPFPLMGGVTPTSGRLVLFGDMGGNFYAFDAASGKQLWSLGLGGAVGGGVISYDTGMGQKIAVAAGMTSPIWPTPKINGKIVVLGL